MASISSKPFGKTPSGESVTLFTMKNTSGMEVQIMNYGGIITKILTPDKNGIVEDVVLGFETLDEYIKENPFFGASVGRYGNRIAKGKFTLDGVGYQLPLNNNGNSLHGGLKGFDKKVWQVISSGETADGPKIVLKYISTDMEEGFPGNLTVHLSYILTAKNELSIEFSATTDKATVINLCNHSYFNLEGQHETIANQDLFINSNTVLETDNENVPTGLLLKVDDTTNDFSNTKKCPEKIDTTFVLNKEKEISASLYSEINNLKMLVFTDQPSVHIYVGGKNDDSITAKENIKYQSNSGICFETQNFPDAPNHSHFPNSVLKKNENYLQKTVYKFEI